MQSSILTNQSFLQGASDEDLRRMLSRSLSQQKPDFTIQEFDQKVGKAAANALALIAERNRQAVLEFEKLKTSKNPKDLAKWITLLKFGVWFPNKYRQALFCAYQWAIKNAPEQESEEAREKREKIAKSFLMRLQFLKKEKYAYGFLPGDFWQGHSVRQVEGRCFDPRIKEFFQKAIIQYTLKKGIDPVEAVNSLCAPDRLMLLDCQLALVIARIQGIKKILGDKAFQKLASANPEKPFSLSGYAGLCNGWFSMTASEQQGRPFHEARIGDVVYYANHRSYLFKHPRGAAQGMNTLVVGYDAKGSALVEGLGLPFSRASFLDVRRALIEEYNRAGGTHPYPLQEDLPAPIKSSSTLAAIEPQLLALTMYYPNEEKDEE